MAVLEIFSLEGSHTQNNGVTPLLSNEYLNRQFLMQLFAGGKKRPVGTPDGQAGAMLTVLVIWYTNFE
jgi:hypothetical protein